MARLVLAEGVQTHPSGYLVHKRHLLNNVIVMCGAGHHVLAKEQTHLTVDRSRHDWYHTSITPTLIDVVLPGTNGWAGCPLHPEA